MFPSSIGLVSSDHFPSIGSLLIPYSSKLETTYQLSAIVVDDDKSAQANIFDAVAHRGLSCQVFETVSHFSRTIIQEPLGCLIINSELPDSPGLSLLKEVNARGWNVPRIVTSKNPDIRMCAEAFRNGAMAYLVKPFLPTDLDESLARAIEMAVRQKMERDQRNEAIQKLALLTQREREVMSKIVQGYPIKSISATFGTSFQAVARHRQRILDKLRLSNDVTLTRWLLESQLMDELFIESEE